MKTESTKTDSSLGEKVREYLIAQGVETPMVPMALSFNGTGRLEQVQEHVKGILELIGLDLNDDSLIETPKRVAKMYLNELFWGLDYANFPKATVVENKMKVDEMVVERHIKVNSQCEHHLLPILGFAHVAYLPNDTVPGLSKINRIVDFFSRRPQIQERLTGQIFYALSHILGTENVAVCIEAEHLCVKTRGVEDACSDTVTTKLGGVFKTSDRVRAEFFSSIALRNNRG